MERNRNEKPISDQIKELETLELKSGMRGLAATQALRLLSLYVRTGDTMSARHLWARISSETKSTNPHFTIVHDIIILLFKKQHPQFLSAARQFVADPGLPPFLRENLEAAYDRVLRQTVDVVNSGFSTISVQDLCDLFALPQKEAISQMKGWTPSADGLYLNAPENVPLKPTSTGDQHVNREMMSKLSEFMCFMENH